MELIKQQEIADNVYERWCNQYASDSWKQDKKKMEIKNKLKGVTDIDEINEIIGNNSWTNCPECGECGKIKNEVLRIGQEPDYESATAYICSECLIKALLMVRPIQFDIRNLRILFEYLTNENSHNKKDCEQMKDLIDWLSPFLEQK